MKRKELHFDESNTIKEVAQEISKIMIESTGEDIVKELAADKGIPEEKACGWFEANIRLHFVNRLNDICVECLKTAGVGINGVDTVITPENS